MTFLANADSAGIAPGARVPIILTSRAETVRAAGQLRRCHEQLATPGR